MRYPTVDDIRRINEIEQQSVGGEDAYPTIHSKVAALAESLVRNHAFMDGNKRTALIALAWFYSLNGWWLHASQDDAVNLILAIADGRLRGVAAIADRLEPMVHQIRLESD